MKIKSAFTLAEISIFFIILGILVAVMLTTFKPKQAIALKNVKYKYAAVYDALNIAVFDLVEKDTTNPFVVAGGDSVEGYKKLCNGLADYINTNETNCDIAPIPSDVAYAKDENFDFKTLTPHLSSLTGVNFYISEMLKDDKFPKNTRSYYNSEKPDYDLKYYMVYADLNAKDNKNRVHSIKYTAGDDKDVPDVFAFAVIPEGAAIPMGVAEYNIKYFQTSVTYRNNNIVYYSPYYSYAHAKHMAWGWYSTSGTSENTFREKLPFTYNDYIKEILKRHNTELYNFESLSAFNTKYNEPLFSKCVPPSGTALTPYDLCWITVDTPHFGEMK